jgi:hypothetical protein
MHERGKKQQKVLVINFMETKNLGGRGMGGYNIKVETGEI